MQSLLIKAGKAFQVLRRDGFWRGFSRITRAFLAQFAPIGDGDILLISGGVGDSARYRTRHVAEELSHEGFRARATTQVHPNLFRALPRFSVFVFHRTLVDAKLGRFIAQAKQAGKTILFDTDDLVFDPSYLKHMDYFRQMNRLERKLYENGVGAELLSDAYVTHATTSTRFLAGKLAERGKEVILVTNKLSSEDVRLAETLFAEREKRPHDGALRICYLSGTPSHNRDFATINEPLLRILARYKETRLVLAGPLDTEDVLNRFADRIERIPYAPRAEYFKTVSGMDLNLAPLEIGNPFCEAKSELKFFESGIVGVPTVAAGTATFKEAIEDGVDGFVASGAEEWFEKLSRLIEDEALRKEMGRRARQTALARYTTASGASPEYYAYLRSVLNP